MIQVAAPTHMIATDDRLPTGGTEPVDGTPFDLREPRKLSDLTLDDVYLGVGPETPIRFTFESLGLGLRLVQRTLEQLANLLELNRFADVIEGVEVDRLARSIECAVRGHDYDRQVRGDAANFFERGQSISARHLHVHEYDSRLLLAHGIQRIPAIGDNQGLVPFSSQEIGERIADSMLIISYQYSRHV